MLMALRCAVAICAAICVALARAAGACQGNTRQEEEREREEILQQREERRRNAEEKSRQQRERRKTAYQKIVTEREIAATVQETRELEETRAAAVNSLYVEIDLYIRTRKKFDARNPLVYRCNISSIHKVPAICAALAIVQSTIYKQNDANNNSSTTSMLQNKQLLHMMPGLVDHGEGMVSVRYKTPFQGDATHRVYGYYRCGGC
mmetsp:Transcript_12495/g.20775  ORF Transcript_12495/g.20775 Transcript_12495/m.20775 type:complete len:205 (+) Transcript_12495:57-671(+)